MHSLGQNILLTGNRAPTQLLPATAAPSLAISNSNLTVSRANFAGWAFVRASNPRSSGKWYFEVRIDQIFDGVYGLVNPSIFPDHKNWYLGSYPGSYGIEDISGRAYPGLYGAGSGIFAAGDIVQVAVDLDSGRMWFGRNNNWVGNPSAGSGMTFTGVFGPMVPAVGLYCNAPCAATCRFSSGFSYAAPVSFRNWG